MDMRIVESFPRRVREIENLWIPLADGTRLAARIWLPEDAEQDPVPAILEYLPYRKRDGTAVRDQLTHPYFAGHGYAGVRVDMRGNGESDGLMFDEYLKQEQDDAIEVIAWLAAQPWCSGTVGMIGISWGGFNGLQVAMRRPPALKAVVSICSTVDRYAVDIHHMGGCLLLENLGWSATMHSYSSRPPDPALVGDRWREIWLERLEQEPLLIETWLQHQRRDDYWRHGSVCEDWSAIEAPVLAVGGWADGYTNAVPELVAKLEAPCKGIIGPWLHKYPHFAVPEPRIGFLQECLRWWDRWLKGIDTGVESDPDLRAYLMDGLRPATYYKERPGRWVAEPAWPSPRIVPTELVFTETGLGDGSNRAPVRLLASPQTTGSVGGEWCPIWLGADSPADQRPDDACSVVFDGAPLAAPLDILGAAEVELDLESDKPQGFVVVRLCEVFPDGASTRVTYGVLNLAHRDSHAEPTAVPVGTPFRVRFALDDIGYSLKPGNRIRVAISNAYWPLLWPSPEAATLTVRGGRIILPVRPAGEEVPVRFEPAEAAPPLKLERLKPAENSRVLRQDMASGVWTLTVYDDFGVDLDTTNGLAGGEIGRETYSIHPDDPLSAKAECHWTQVMSRPGWSIRTEARSSLRSDRDSFHVEGSLEAYEGETLVLERRWSRAIPRDQM
jgi:putative CocE/NonD family hydrolase